MSLPLGSLHWHLPPRQNYVIATVLLKYDRGRFPCLAPTGEEGWADEPCSFFSQEKPSLKSGSERVEATSDISLYPQPIAELQNLEDTQLHHVE